MRQHLQVLAHRRLMMKNTVETGLPSGAPKGTGAWR
jgi:hypothetical protein